MEEACIGNDYNLLGKVAPNMNDACSISKRNNKNYSSKQASTDKSHEKGKEKENTKEKEKER
jgi:hypothetical protein